MQTPTISKEVDQLSPTLRRAFGPLRKRALGLAVGLVCGGLLFLVTAYHILFHPALPAVMSPETFGARPVAHLELLGQFFSGYDPFTFTGAFFGFAWAGGLGFFLGFGVAALRNAVVRISLFVVRARGNLGANKGFLDQI